MNAHFIEFMGNCNGTSDHEQKKRAQIDFGRLSSNKLGEILKSAGAETLNCMKLVHYLPIYEELFSKLCHKQVKLLEIGVQHGGSYRLWSNFFGEALLEWTGIDIEPRCLQMNKILSADCGRVYCGSQNDSTFLEQVIAERGPFDIIIDDGSHMSDHIVKSFQVLATAVVPDGLYIVEDVHACYWTGFRSETKNKNAVEYFQSLVHSLNRQALEHPRRSSDIDYAETILSPAPLKKIEFLPSMIICHMGYPEPMIEWKAGLASIQIGQ